MTDCSTTQLAALIAQRLQRLTQLRDLGMRQTELIAAGEMAGLLRLLAAKHQIIAAVQAIEKELAPFHEQDPNQRPWESDEARRRCAEQAEQCRRLIDEVMKLERTNEQQMVARQREVASQLRTVNAAHKARTAYAVDASRGSPDKLGRPHQRDDDSTDRQPAGIDLAT